MIPRWMLEAPCQDSDDHFPAPSEGIESVRVRRAKRMCLRCPYRQRCLAVGLTPARPILVRFTADGGQDVYKGEYRIPVGIWGGATERERKAVAHLSPAEQMEALDLWLRTQTNGPFAVATREEIVA